jgi:hypothetical protein
VYSFSDLAEVRIREDVLSDGEAAVAVLAHELWELQRLREIIAQEGGSITGRYLNELTRGSALLDDGSKNLHGEAWEISDYYADVFTGRRR